MRTRLPVRFKLALVTAALTFGILCIFAVVIGAVAEQRIRAGFDDDLRASVDRFAAAWERADVDAVKALLAEDAIFAMPPHAVWFQGRDAIADFLGRFPLRPGAPRERVIPTRANGQLAFGHYRWKDGRFAPHALIVLALRGSEIAELTVFLTTEPFARFALPEVID